MEVHHTFCHSKDEGASDLSPRCYPESPLDWLCVQLEELKATVTLPDSDGLLIEKDLLMPLFDVNSIHDLDISAADKNRLYFLMSQKSQPIAELLTQVGYELFFTEVDAFGSASACDRSRYRPHLIADDTKVAKADSSCMEYLTDKKLSSRRGQTAGLQFGGSGRYLWGYRLGNSHCYPALAAQNPPRLSKQAAMAQSDD